MEIDGKKGSSQEAFWRERAQQLQQALGSRVVIEQAKGILAERLGLGLDGAFGLLRYAARSERVKLHDLARSVVVDAETPEPIVRALARHPGTFVAVPREPRILQTEELYRRLNTAIATLLGDGQGAFLCECSNPLCNEPIELDKDELVRLHGTPGQYAVLPGHQIPEIETVVFEGAGYAVVRKSSRT